jgi:serine/threonine protein kinase
MPHDRSETPTPLTESCDDETESFLREVAGVAESASCERYPMPPLEKGAVVGERFVIECPVRQGGMGTVYRATDRTTGRPVAIKAMARQGQSFADRFIREAVVLSELSHSCIVRYVSHGLTSDGLPFVAMDWLEGEDLAERLARCRLEPAQGLSLVRRASEGLALAHARGVIHRDVKPSNLFLVDRDPTQVKVIDFGVARIADGPGAFTRPGTTLGTAGYMAPEQAAGVPDIDARADVYGLGCVLFECLTGRPPLVGAPAALLVKVLRDEPPRASLLNPELSEGADALLATLLAKDRKRRPKDAGELLQVLERVGKLVR